MTRCSDAPFEKLLATGITILLGVQSFIIMAGVTRLLPLTGVALPFVSYGGSSLVANYVLLSLPGPHLQRHSRSVLVKCRRGGGRAE